MTVVRSPSRSPRGNGRREAEVGLLLAARALERVRSVTAVTATERVTAEIWRAAEPLRAACRSAAAGGDAGVLFDRLVPATFSPAFRAA